MRRSIGPDQPVGAEVRVVTLLAEVAAVRPVLTSVGRGLEDPVVDPFPDEPSLEGVVAIEGGVIVGEAPVRVAHRVGVLAEDDRTRIVARPGKALDALDLRVHRADDVGRVVPTFPVTTDRALVVQRSARVTAPDPACGGVVVRSVPALVAE